MPSVKNSPDHMDAVFDVWFFHPFFDKIPDRIKTAYFPGLEPLRVMNNIMLRILVG